MKASVLELVRVLGKPDIEMQQILSERDLSDDDDEVG
jgi:hypothetical protein